MGLKSYGTVPRHLDRNTKTQFGTLFLIKHVGQITARILRDAQSTTRCCLTRIEITQTNLKNRVANMGNLFPA